MKYAGMKVTKVKQQQRFHMVKSLSGNICQFFKLEMAVWARSPE